VIEFLLAAALSLLVAYFVIRKAVHAILDADAERRDDARRERMETSHVLRHASEADKREHPPPDHEHPLHDNAASSLGSADGPDARSRGAYKASVVGPARSSVDLVTPARVRLR
jgi:hypothetical protein